MFAAKLQNNNQIAKKGNKKSLTGEPVRLFSEKFEPLFNDNFL
jgi:hypothetical protein